MWDTYEEMKERFCDEIDGLEGRREILIQELDKLRFEFFQSFEEDLRLLVHLTCFHGVVVALLVLELVLR
jgi:hypothetical protein